MALGEESSKSRFADHYQHANLFIGIGTDGQELCIVSSIFCLPSPLTVESEPAQILTFSRSRGRLTHVTSRKRITHAFLPDGNFAQSSQLASETLELFGEHLATPLSETEDVAYLTDVMEGDE